VRQNLRVCFQRGLFVLSRLQAANKVICFDLDFNPSHDEQAQDRAFRIGQKQDVQVVRLISQGTIEEQKYIRQIYKVHLKNDTIKDAQEAGQARLFRGVQGDKQRKGEVFGIENLLKFKDGSFMSDLWKSSESRPSRKDKTVKVDDLANALTSLSEEQVEEIGGNALDEDFHLAATAAGDDSEDGISNSLGGTNAIKHQDLFRAHRGDAALKQGDDGFEEETGGATQITMDVLDAERSEDGRGTRAGTEEPSGDEVQERINVAEAVGGANALNHQDLFARRDQDSDDEEDREEVLGGASQNCMAIFDREAADDDDEDEYSDHPEPQAAAAPAVPIVLAAFREESSSPEKDTRTETVLPRKRRLYSRGSAAAVLMEPIDEGRSAGLHFASVVESFPDEEHDFIEAAQKRPKKKARLPKAKKQEEKTTTTFSAGDIALPAYGKKKKKKKKSKK